jgi:hypothetical protein
MFLKEFSTLREPPTSTYFKNRMLFTLSDAEISPFSAAWAGGRDPSFGDSE